MDHDSLVSYHIFSYNTCPRIKYILCFGKAEQRQKDISRVMAQYSMDRAQTSRQACEIGEEKPRVASTAKLLPEERLA